MRDLYFSIARSVLARYSVYIVNLGSTAVLSRTFTPEQFGTVGAILVFTGLFQLISEAGLGPAVINMKKLSPEDRNGIFSFTLLAGLVFAACFLILGPSIANFYSIPKIAELTPVFCIAVLFFSVSIVPNALLARDQAFKAIAVSGLTAEVSSLISTVVLSHLIDPSTALASKTPVSSGVGFIMVWFYSSRTEFGRPRFGIKLGAIRPILSFSGFQFGFNAINFASRNLDNVLIGRYIGVSVMAHYDKAYQLMRYPLMLLTFAMTPAIQPVLRRFAHDLSAVEAIHTAFVARLSILGAISGLAVFFLSDTIVAILLGSQWQSVSPILSILAISVPIQVVLSTIGSFYQALNRADLLFLTGVISAIAMISAITVGTLYGSVEMICWGLVIAFHMNFITAYCILYQRVFRGSLIPFFLRMIPMGLTNLIMMFLQVFSYK